MDYAESAAAHRKCVFGANLGGGMGQYCGTLARLCLRRECETSLGERVEAVTRSGRGDAGRSSARGRKDCHDWKPQGLGGTGAYINIAQFQI